MPALEHEQPASQKSQLKAAATGKMILEIIIKMERTHTLILLRERR